MPKTPASNERVRVTVTVLPEVVEIFKRMAESSGVSLSRCMGDWLADTAEGAQFVAGKIEAARASPMTVMRELHAMTNGLGEAIQLKADEWRKASLAEGAPLAGRGRQDGLVGGVSPPSSNTGGKGPSSGSGGRS